MKPHILPSGTSVEVSLKRRRGMRRLALSVSGDGSVSLTAPRSTPLWYIERFLARQSGWLERAIQKLGLSNIPFAEKKARDRAQYLRHRESARRYAEKRLDELNRAYGFSYRRLSIRNQRTRWGSCSATGSLSINYRVLFLTPALADYVFVHELAHLTELNHSERFWQTVAATIPDYQERRRALHALAIDRLGETG